MKTELKLLTLLVGTCSVLAQDAPGAPEANGATPKSATIYVNTGAEVHNGNTESLGVAIAGNGNVIVGWEDDGAEENFDYLGAVWTMYNSNGQPITASRRITSNILPGETNSRFLSYFRADHSPTPGGTSWGPKIKANLFGDGVGMGATSYYLGFEIPELASIQADEGGPDTDFPTVQLLHNSGDPSRVVSGVSDAYAQRPGAIRIGDWDYLSNGNVLIVGESRQGADLVDVYGGAGAANHAVFRILDPAGNVVKAETLASETAIKSEIWHGSAVTEGGFAIRFSLDGRGTIRIFRNDGTPAGGNIDLEAAAGNPGAASGGRGEGIGFAGNGKDAYVLAYEGVDENAAPAVIVTVLNADGTRRYTKVATSDFAVTNPERVHAAIDEHGRVAVVFDDMTAAGSRIVMGRLLAANGTPMGGTFYVSEKELPVETTATAQRARVAFRDELLAVAWESRNAPDDTGPTVALRTFSVSPTKGVGPVAEDEGGLTPVTPVIHVNNPPDQNNGNTESIGVAIAKNGNVIFGWEDDGEEENLDYLGAVWTMYNSAGQAITAPRTITSPLVPGATVTSRFLSFFRPDGSATPGGTSWGPKIKANLFGDGVGMGTTSYYLGFEIPALAPIQDDDGGPDTDFPTVQLLGNGGEGMGVLSGVSDAYAQRQGAIRIGDWDFLGNGNILIVGESRQGGDLVDLYGGDAAANHAIYRIVSPTGAQVKSEAMVSEVPVNAQIWHGSAVTANGFAIRFGGPGGGTIRIFNNDGTPVTGNIDLATVTGLAPFSGGGRGEDVGFAGNGKDRYVIAVKGVVNDVPGVWFAVLNADGSLRFVKEVAAELDLTGVNRVHAAIDEEGRVLVAFGDTSPTGGAASSIIAQIFAPNGDALGAPFIVSNSQLNAESEGNNSPRVALRGGLAAITWVSSSSPATDKSTIAGRIFQLPTAAELRVTATKAGNSIRLTIEGGTAPFLVQGTLELPDDWADLVTTSKRTIDIPMLAPEAFFRVQSAATRDMQLFQALLNGAAERPAPVTTPASGTGFLAVDTATRAASGLIMYQNLKQNATAAHIHGPADANTAAGVMVGAVAASPLATSGVFAINSTLTQVQFDAVRAGNTYFNVHSGAHGGGEIRGQLTEVAR